MNYLKIDSVHIPFGCSDHFGLSLTLAPVSRYSSKPRCRSSAVIIYSFMVCARTWRVRYNILNGMTQFRETCMPWSWQTCFISSVRFTAANKREFDTMSKWLSAYRIIYNHQICKLTLTFVPTNVTAAFSRQLF